LIAKGAKFVKMAAFLLIAAIASAQSQHLAPMADPAVNYAQTADLQPSLTRNSFSRRRAGIRRRPLRLPHRIFLEIFAVLSAVFRALRVFAVKLLAIAVVFSPASSTEKGTHTCVTF
jgi:hypothetical protein